MGAADGPPRAVGAQRRPADVQARECREVVLTAGQITGGAGEHIVLGHDVDDAGHSEPRWGHRQQPEQQQRHGRHDDEGDADTAVLLGVQEQHPQQDARQGYVVQAVAPHRHLRQYRGAGKPMVGRRLDTQAQRTFHRLQSMRVGRRPAGRRYRPGCATTRTARHRRPGRPLRPPAGARGARQEGGDSRAGATLLIRLDDPARLPGRQTRSPVDDRPGAHAQPVMDVVPPLPRWSCRSAMAGPERGAGEGDQVVRRGHAGWYDARPADSADR